ncbi:MAG TPA: hypothetical protein VN947_01190 [Polyangia bacterium]|nr:hypothetical protein [Polyangia bacterium]
MRPLIAVMMLLWFTAPARADAASGHRMIVLAGVVDGDGGPDRDLSGIGIPLYVQGAADVDRARTGATASLMTVRF